MRYGHHQDNGTARLRATPRAVRCPGESAGREGVVGMQGISLRPHQVEAVDSIIEGLALPLNGTVPASGQRGQVRMSTGSGKTITAAVAALRL
ncbi:DEAD/DEAH box helicase family protein, partial [Streptomyces sp. NPDC048215]|uniref:DEAD/DEAH box helicase family protein n=1 Tax=Streptomyces sp. NPDC048215 TaxID=3156690 RepID=UPI0033C2CF5A